MSEQDKEVKIPDKEELLGDQQQTETSEKEAPEYTEVEKAAMAQGWKPKDQWDGDPNQHRSAREYLDRGELLGKIKSQNQQLGEFREAIKQMADHNKRVYQAGFEQAIKDLKAQKMMALKDGDAEAVLAIDDKIEEQRGKLEEVKAQQVKISAPPKVSDTTTNWLAVNQWYQTETAMKYAANGFAADFASRNPNASEEEIYAFIDKEIRKEFPHKFKTTQAAPSPDGDSRRGGGGKPTSGNATFEKVLSTMTEEQQTIARSLVRSGAITKDKYVEDWNKISGGR